MRASQPPLTRVQRRTAVARLALRGCSQAEIAAALNVNQGTVSRDLREVRQAGRTAEARALRQADEAALARVNLLGCQLWDVLDVSRDEGLFVARTKYHPRTGRRTEIDTLTELPGGEPRCFLWLIECGRLRQAIEDRLTGKRHREPYVLQTRIMRIADALRSLQRKYPTAEQVSQPVVSTPVPDPPSAVEGPAPTAGEPSHDESASKNSGADPRIYAATQSQDDHQPLAGQPVTMKSGSHRFSSGREDLTAESAEGRRDEDIKIVTTAAALGDLRGSPRSIVNRVQQRQHQKTSRADLHIYADASVQDHPQPIIGRSVAMNPASRSFLFLCRFVRFTRCRRLAPEPRARGPPTARSVSPPGFPLSALRFPTGSSFAR